MAEKFACMQCGFIFDDPDMEMCPQCGTELGKEWDPEDLVDVLVTDLAGAKVPDLIRVVAEISGYPTQKIGPMLQKLPAVVFSGATPMQAELYLEKIRATNAAAMAESAHDKSSRLAAEANAAGAAATAATEQARLSAAERQAKLDAEMKLKAQQLEAEAKANAELDAKLAAERAEAEKIAAEAKAKADAEATALAAEQAKIKAAELEKVRLETEARKAEAEAAKAAEIARGQEEARLAAEKAAEEEARRLARERELAETTVVCSKCKARYDKNMKFCPECGKANESLNPVNFICSKCGKEASYSEKICQSCGGTVVKDDPQWLQNMLELQKTIPYPAKKVCDVNIKPGYLSAVALSEYMEKHLGYFFEKVEVEDGLIFIGRTAIKTPASAEEIRCGHPRTKKNQGGDFLSLYFRINLNKNGNPENYSLYLKTENSAEHTPLYTKLLALIIGCPLGLVFVPLVTLFLPDSIAEVVLETINFSNLPNSSTGKLKFKKQQTYALLALYLGFLGAHDFYAGKKWKAIVHLLLTIPLGIFLIPAGISLLWAWWEIASGKDASTTVETV